MNGIELVVLSVALGMDLLSVSIPIGMTRVRRALVFRAAAVFALFHIVFILSGYTIGRWFGNWVEHVGAYHTEVALLQVQSGGALLGALVLMCLGLYMLRQYFLGTAAGTKQQPLEGGALLALAASVSVDALAAGFSMGMLEVNLWILSGTLGAVIFSIALVGLGLGRQAGRWLGNRGELAGGLVLVLLGLHTLWTLVRG